MSPGPQRATALKDQVSGTHHHFHDPKSRVVTLDAKPSGVEIDCARTAVIVVDMQNDFGAKGGMFHRADIDISPIRAVVEPTPRVLASAADGRHRSPIDRGEAGMSFSTSL